MKKTFSAKAALETYSKFEKDVVYSKRNVMTIDDVFLSEEVYDELDAEKLIYIVVDNVTDEVVAFSTRAEAEAYEYGEKSEDQKVLDKVQEGPATDNLDAMEKAFEEAREEFREEVKEEETKVVETVDEEVTEPILKEEYIKTVGEVNEEIARKWRENPVVIDASASKVKVIKLPKFSDVANIAILNLMEEVETDNVRGEHKFYFRVNGLGYSSLFQPLLSVQRLLKDAAKGKNVILVSPNGRDLMRTPNDGSVSVIIERDGEKVGEIGFKIVKNVIRLDFAEYDGGVLCKSETGS